MSPNNPFKHSPVKATSVIGTKVVNPQEENLGRHQGTHMNHHRRHINQFLATAAAALCLSGLANTAKAATAEDLNTDANQTLQNLIKANPTALTLSKTAHAVLIFPKIVKAVKHLHDTKGWEIGAGPNVVVVNEGMAKNLSSSTLREDVYAFIVDQTGLMASLSIEGTKVSRIRKPD
jgi:lipid-binding SYLF domain-containing protein